MPKLLYPINPDRNKPWNELPSLPIDAQLYETIEIYKILGEAKQALGELQGRSAVLPDPDLLINSISLQEAKSSSEIENIFTTNDELYKAFSDNDSDFTGSAKEVLRYREALKSGLDYLNKDKKFSIDYFVHLFQEIKQSNDTIRPEFSKTHIRQGGTGPHAGKTIYTPPSKMEIITDRLANLTDFLNDDKKYDIDPLIKMAIAHFQFEAIHPFRDGNGRTGRIINIHYLMHKGLLDYPVLFLSSYILQYKEDYYTGLQGVSQRGNWNNWIIFMLKAIKVTATLAYQKINEITEAKTAITEHLRNEKFKNTDQLIEAIFMQPYTKVEHLVNGKIYAEKTARNYLNRLCELRVLEKKTIRGNHYYLNLELFKVLAD
jgi:Fic family protein